MTVEWMTLQACRFSAGNIMWVPAKASKIVVCAFIVWHLGCNLSLLFSSFSPTCVLKDVDDYHCDACLTGYEGQYCER